MSSSPYPHSDRDLIARIARSPGARAGYKQLIRELGLGGGRQRRLLVEQLTRITARGDLAFDRDVWSLPSTQKAVPPRSGDAAAPRDSRDRFVGGRLDLHRDGFGFVRPDLTSGKANAGDIFIPPNEINGAMQGDQVLVDESLSGRPANGVARRSGRVVRVLTRRNPSVVGIFHYARPRGRDGVAYARNACTVVPIDDRLGEVEVGEPDDTLSAVRESRHRTLGDEVKPRRAPDPRWPLEGLAVDIEITQFPAPGRPAHGRVMEVLGHPDDFGVDVEIVIRKHHIPHTFPAPVLAEADAQAQRTVATLTEEELAGREDFRTFPIVTIDGETARDFDDAVLVRPLPNGNTELQVHIADVSWFVTPGSSLDTEARVRGTSVYFPDRAVPMLPHALSSGLCSLLPNQDRLVLSCIMEVDPEGEIAGYRVTQGIIRSARRCTYTSVQHCIDAASGTASADKATERARVAVENPGLPEAVDAMLALALRLNAKRVRRGSIDFDLPEPVVEFDPDGNMRGIVRSERGWSHRLIEEFMLSANECVATWLEQQGIPSIYRIHEVPDPKRILDFEEVATGFGHSLGLAGLAVKRFTMKSDRRESRQRSARGQDARPAKEHDVPERIPVTPQMYQRLVRRIAGTPEERILAYLMLRSLKQARYAEQNEGHFALASPSYTHFTSPIRRYPDLIVHRLLRAMLQRGADPRGGPVRSDDAQPWKNPEALPPRLRSSASATPPLPAEELNDMAVESSQAERRAADAERELIEWKKMRFMADKIGDDFAGIILSVTKHGFFVELDDMFIEGLVPLSSLVGDSYAFRDTDRTIVGARTGHAFAMGQRVEVILDRIDRQQRRLQFALLPGTEPVANTGKPARSSRAGKSAEKKARGKSKRRKTSPRT